MANIMQGITHRTLQAMYTHAHYLTNLLPSFQKGVGVCQDLIFKKGWPFWEIGGLQFSHTQKNKSEIFNAKKG